MSDAKWPLCRESLSFEPSAESAGCDVADGISLRADVVHIWQPSGVALFVDAGLLIERVTRCGARRHALARDALRRFAPALVAAPLAPSEAATFSSGACRDPRLSIEAPEGARHEQHGAAFRFSLAGALGEVRVLLGGRAVSSWPVGSDTIEDRCHRGQTVPVARSVDLEVLCSGDRAIIAGSSWVPERCWECFARCRAAPTPPRSVACSLDGLPTGSGARRLRVSLTGHEQVPVVIPRPALAQSAR